MNRNQPPTMAEKFCRRHMISWRERGEAFADWRDPAIFDDTLRMLAEGALTMSYILEEDDLLWITLFRDRSWIVQKSMFSGEPPELGTGAQEDRIMEIIHQTLGSELEYLEELKAQGIDRLAGPNDDETHSLELVNETMEIEPHPPDKVKTNGSNPDRDD